MAIVNVLFLEGAGKDVNAEVGWGVVSIIILGLAAAGVGGYAVYKYRIRVCLKLFSLILNLINIASILDL